MNILFLWSEYVAYLDGMMHHLVSDHKANVTIVSWDKDLLKPFYSPNLYRLCHLKRSTLTTDDLKVLIEDSKPDILCVSGWMDSSYLAAIHASRNRTSYKTICGFDDNWTGSLRQKLGSIYFRLALRRYFDNA